MWRYRQPGVAFQLLSELQRQQQCNILCDTLLQTEGMSVPVHSCILAAFSPFLYRELSTSPYPMGPRRLIRVPAIGAQALLKLISYLYSGEMKGLGPAEHDEVKAAFIRLGMSHLIHKFEEDSRQWRGIDRGLLLEFEGSSQVGTEKSVSMQSLSVKGVDDKATQTEAESTVHAATQTSSQDACMFSNLWLPPLSHGQESTTQSVEVSPTAGASTFVILTPVSDPSVSNDNVASCQFSLSSPTVHCDPPPSHSPATNLSDMFNPSFETLTLSNSLFAVTAQPDGSVGTLVGKDRAKSLAEAVAVTKGSTSEQSTSKVCRSERLLTIKEKETPFKDKGHTSEESVKGLKVRFKRKCKNALWEIEIPKEVPAMTEKLSMSSAAAQKDLMEGEKRLSNNPTTTHSPTQATSHQVGTTIQDKIPLSPSHFQPEECDEQMDKLLEDIMMDLNFLLPIPTERGDGRLQQRPLPYPPSDTPVLDSTSWLGEAEVSMVNTQMEKGVSCDVMLVSQLGTSFTEGVGSVNEQSSYGFSQVRSAKSHTSTTSPGFPESGRNIGFSPAEFSLANHSWSCWRKIPSPDHISKELKGNSTISYSCIPDLDELRLHSCLSPLQSEDENNVRSQPHCSLPTGQSTSSGVNIPPWLSLTPVDLRFPLNSILLKSPPVTEKLQHPAITRTRRQKTLQAQYSTAPDSKTASGSSISRQSSAKEADLGVWSVATRGEKMGKEIPREQEKSLRKGLRRLMAKRKWPVEENCEMTSVAMSTEVGLQNTNSNVRHSSISTGKKKRRRSTEALTKPKEDLLEVTRQKQGGGHTKSAVGLRSPSNDKVPKRKRGRPPKYANHSAVLSPTVKIAVREARTISTSPKLTPKTNGLRQWTQISSKYSQGQEDNIDRSTNQKTQDEAPNQKESEHQSPTVTKVRSAGANSVQKGTLASGSQLKPASEAEVKTSTHTPSQTLKRFRELLEKKGYLMKRKRSTADEGDVQNSQCLKKDTSTPCEIITSAETETEQAPVPCPLTRSFTYPTGKVATDNQLAPPQPASLKPGAKASRACKWTEGSIGSCDEDEEAPVDLDLEEDVDVISGSPVSLPVFGCGLVGREPSDVEEEIDEDVDVITVDID